MARRPTKKAAPRDFDVLIERDEDGWLIGTVLVLRGCRTQAKSLEVLMSRVREVIQLCLEVESAPPAQLAFVGVQRVRVA